MSNTSKPQSTTASQSGGQSGQNREGTGKNSSGKSQSVHSSSQAGAQEAAKTGDSTVDDRLRPGEDRTSGRPFQGDQSVSEDAVGDELDTDMELGRGVSSQKNEQKHEKADPAKEPTAGSSSTRKPSNNTPIRPGAHREDQKQDGSGDCGCKG